MSKKSRSMDSSQRHQAFSSLAKAYDQSRPSYPAESIKALYQYWHAGNGTEQSMVVLDVGSGTGISTRCLAEFSVVDDSVIIGIEPGVEMMEEAKSIINEFSVPIEYLSAAAEDIPLADGLVDIIVTAQAIQWFDRERFYQEALRLLKPTGVIAVIENNRDWKNSALCLVYEEFLEQYAFYPDGRQYSRYYRDHDYDAELSRHFSSVIQKTFSWERGMKLHGFQMMVKSSTQGKRAIENMGQASAQRAIADLLRPFINTHGELCVRYETKLTLGVMPKGVP